MFIYIVSCTTYYDGGQSIEHVTRDKEEAFQIAKKLMPEHLNIGVPDYVNDIDEYHWTGSEKELIEHIKWMNKEYKQDYLNNLRNLKEYKEIDETYNTKQVYHKWVWATKFEAVEIFEFNM